MGKCLNKNVTIAVVGAWASQTAAINGVSNDFVKVDGAPALCGNLTISGVTSANGAAQVTPITISGSGPMTNKGKMITMDDIDKVKSQLSSIPCSSGMTSGTASITFTCNTFVEYKKG